MKSLLDFGRLFLFSPSKAADACDRPRALRDGLVLYLLLAVGQLASSWLNPLDFLDPNAPVPIPHGAAFWAVVGFWEPVLMALSVFFTVLVLDWMAEGWLPLKTAAATLWSILPAALALYYTSPRATLGRGWFVGMLAAWAVPAVVLARRVPAGRWRRVGIFLLGMSAIQLVGVAAEFLIVVPSRSLPVFYAYSLVLLVWVTACFGIGMRRLGITTSVARAALAFLFALIVGSVVPALAFLLGLMPKEVLKVVLYV